MRIMSRKSYRRKNQVEAAPQKKRSYTRRNGGVQMNITVPKQNLARWRKEANDMGIPYPTYVQAKMNGGLNGHRHANPTVQAVSTIFDELEKLQPEQQKNVLKFIIDAVNTGSTGL